MTNQSVLHLVFTVFGRLHGTRISEMTEMNKMRTKFSDCLVCTQPCNSDGIAGFSSTPYLESLTPTFGLGTPVYPRISSNLHCGTPTFSKRCLWDSYFQNPSENPGLEPSCVGQLLFTNTAEPNKIFP